MIGLIRDIIYHYLVFLPCNMWAAMVGILQDLRTPTEAPVAEDECNFDESIHSIDVNLDEKYLPPIDANDFIESPGHVDVVHERLGSATCKTPASE